MTVINLKRRVQVPFPSNVVGAAGITVTKNGSSVWVIQPDLTQLSSLSGSADPTIEQTWVYNSVTKGWNVMSLSAIGASIATLGAVSIADVNYTALAADRFIVFTALTASRQVNLPAAGLFGKGTLVIEDGSGNAGSAALISAVPAGADVINGANATLAVIGGPFGRTVLDCDGVSAWRVSTSYRVTPVLAGGTGLTGGTSGGVPYFSGTNAIASSAVLGANQLVLGGGAGVAPASMASLGTATTVLHGNAAGPPTWAAVSLTADVTGTLAATLGGTGNATYAIGDLLQASTTSALSRLASVATGSVLISGGVGVISSWGKVGLTTHISGTLAEGNGGTNQSTYTLGDTLYASAANTLSKLAGNITGTRKFLRQTGTGTVSAAPAWDTLLAADVPGSALTKTDDTNVTLTLGGTPASALLAAASITAGWTGTLSVLRGGTGGGAASGTLLDNISGFASTGFINRTGAGTYSFSTASGILDGIGATQGNVLFRGAAGWQALAVGVSGQVLQSGGPAANPSWATITGTGTVTSVGPDSGGKGVYSLIGGTYSTSAAVTTAGTLGLTGITHPGGRITISTGVADLTATVTGATSIFYTPYAGQFVPIWNGTVFVLTDMGGELTQTLADTTKSPAAAVASTNYDIFVWNDAGTIRATRGPTWNAGAVAGSDTARGTGAASTELQRLNGILTNKNAITNGPAANKGTYVGTIRTNASGTLDFVLGTFGAGPGPTTAANVCLWNQYNRIMWATSFGDTSASYTYATTTWRQAHGSTTMQISFVTGQNEGIVTADYDALGNTSTNVGVASIGVDTNSAFTTGATSGLAASASLAPMHSSWRAKPGLGSHFLSAIEIGDTGVSFVGQRVAGQQAGMSCTGFY